MSKGPSDAQANLAYNTSLGQAMHSQTEPEKTQNPSRQVALICPRVYFSSIIKLLGLLRKGNRCSLDLTRSLLTLHCFTVQTWTTFDICDHVISRNQEAWRHNIITTSRYERLVGHWSGALYRPIFLHCYLYLARKLLHNHIYRKKRGLHA
jgi:hypothetical protein